MSVEATIASPVVSGTSTNASTTNTSSTATAGIADNFQTFLTLLTTQLQNQNPLDPLDTNQFTQQLVQFAGVEQQLRQNDQLKTLIGHTDEAHHSLEVATRENLDRVLIGQPPRYVVNPAVLPGWTKRWGV